MWSAEKLHILLLCDAGSDAMNSVLRPHEMSSECFLRSTTHISLYSIHRMAFLSNGSTLRSLWATKWIFVCTEYFSYTWLFGGLSPRHTGFKSTTVNVGFVVGNFALAHVLRMLRFIPVTVLPPMLTITLHSFVKQAGKAWELVSGNIYIYIYIYILNVQRKLQRYLRTK